MNLREWIHWLLVCIKMRNNDVADIKVDILVLMMRKVSMSIVLMGLLAPLVVMVRASLQIVKNDQKTISRHKGCWLQVIQMKIQKQIILKLSTVGDI